MNHPADVAEQILLYHAPEPAGNGGGEFALITLIIDGFFAFNALKLDGSFVLL